MKPQRLPKPALRFPVAFQIAPRTIAEFAGGSPVRLRWIRVKLPEKFLP
jgi:hypothetical protein